MPGSLWGVLEPAFSILLMYYTHIEDSSCWIVMELCDLGDMDKFFKEKNPNMQTRINLMLQIAMGIHHLHSQKTPIVHRDLKPANIMLKADSCERPVIKIADFGLAKLLDHASPSEARMMTIAGSDAFMAPEILALRPYDISVDIFALGLVFLVMIKYGPGCELLIPLCEGQTQAIAIGSEMLQTQRDSQELPTLIRDAATDSVEVKRIKSLVRKMAAYDPNNRPKIPQVLQAIKSIQPQPIAAPRRGLIRPPSAGDTKLIDAKEDSEYNYIEQFQAGDLVFSETSIPQVQKLQKFLFETWSETIIPYLGKEGKVVERTESSLVVEYNVPGCDRARFEYHPELLMKVPSQPTSQPTPIQPTSQPTPIQPTSQPTPIQPTGSQPNSPHPASLPTSQQSTKNPRRKSMNTRLSCGDIVCIPEFISQANQDKQYLETRGIVYAVDKSEDSAHVICATGAKYTLELAVLKHSDMAGQVIDEGDMVIICADKDMMHATCVLSDEHTMALSGLFGKAGLLVNINQDDTVLVEFIHDRKLRVINIKAMKILYKEDYLKQHSFRM